MSSGLNIAAKRKSDLADKRAENLRANLMRRKQQAKARDDEDSQLNPQPQESKSA